MSGANAGAPVADLWVRMSDPQASDTVHEIGLGYVEERDGDWFHMHGSEAMPAALDRAGLPWRRALAPPPAVPWRRPDMPPGDAAGYHSPEQMNEALSELAQAWPDLAQLVDIGASLEGRRVQGLRLTATDTPRMGWRVLGTHHGDELSSAEVTLGTARDLLENYGSDGVITDLLDMDVVWVVPHINPDGVAASARYNARNVDLNRNYDYQWSSSEWSSGDAAFSEPETRNVRTLQAWTPAGAGLSLHSGEANIGWVWNYTVTPAPDDALLTALAQVYTDTCGVRGFWATNGAEWYVTHGDTTDWSYGRFGTLDFTLEVSDVKTPDPSAIPTLIEAHLPAIRGFLTWPDVVAGQVVDADSGRGIPATVALVGEAWPTQTGPDGRFGRPVLSGSWTAEVSAPGYQDTSFSLSTLAPSTVPMRRQTLTQLRPDPALLSRGGAGEFTLDHATSAVTLSRPGVDPVVAHGDGERWAIDLEGLEPGPWTIEVDDAVAPRSIFIGEIDDAVQIEAVSAARGDQLQVQGSGFAVGSRAWALWGVDRAPVSLEVITEDTDSITLDAAPLEQLTDTVDLIILTGGRQLVVLDILGEPAVDTAEPSDTGSIDTGTATGDTGPDQQDLTPDDGRLTASGCAAVPGFPPWMALVSLAAALTTRRKPAPRDPANGAPQPCSPPSPPA